MRSDESLSLVKGSVETADRDFGLCTTRERNCGNPIRRLLQFGWVDLVCRSRQATVFVFDRDVFQR
jgi:hypothetical protein